MNGSGPAPVVPRDGSGAMFDAIAARYDLLNRLLTFGIDQRWRRKAVDSLRLPAGAVALDLATGTGDMALQLLKRHPDARVIGVDPSARMLEVGREKVARRGLETHIDLVLGNAEALPFDSLSFDGACMAFGIRNVPDRRQALREIARVLRPGARIAILELTEPTGILGPLARFYIHRLVPRVGAWLSGAKEYRYLEQSIARFPPPLEFAGQMRMAGLRVERVVPLMFGVCHLFIATPERRD